MAHDGLQSVVSAARPGNETRNICTHTKEDAFKNKGPCWVMCIFRANSSRQDQCEQRDNSKGNNSFQAWRQVHLMRSYLAIKWPLIMSGVPLNSLRQMNYCWPADKILRRGHLNMQKGELVAFFFWVMPLILFNMWSSKYHTRIFARALIAPSAFMAHPYCVSFNLPAQGALLNIIFLPLSIQPIVSPLRKNLPDRTRHLRKNNSFSFFSARLMHFNLKASQTLWLR